ncbi:hypothetical protein HAX54_022897 [Datura stramonium]|uniref:Uncharacterized protein n=1 Tax=Datura stramonium TaxID=4076 RepID=A0ABS8UVF8_DATST|nr:hypothetical protein [Datura stramonium]
MVVGLILMVRRGENEGEERVVRLDHLRLVRSVMVGREERRGREEGGLIGVNGMEVDGVSVLVGRREKKRVCGVFVVFRWIWVLAENARERRSGCFVVERGGAGLS